MHQDHAGSRFGMWIFLLSELLLFGALFLMYGFYASRYPGEFSHAAKSLSVIHGTTNTVVLLTSSLLVALAVIRLKSGAARNAIWNLSGALLLALTFLGIKAVEWGAKFHHGIYPGAPELLARPKGEIVFFNLYYVITGLHAIHVIIGATVLAIVALMIHRGRVTAGEPTTLENSGLYWHLVDVIWIYVFPLFYLVVP